jgi:O-antigen/teichoic acid export membrane protein
MESVTAPSNLTQERPSNLIASSWRRVKNALDRRPFFRDVSIMLTGTAGGQLVSILLSPILTRLYTPEQFGILSVYLALLAIFVVVASLRYELTIPLASSDSDAFNLMLVCGCVLVLTTSAMTVGALTFPAEILQRIWPSPISADDLMIYRALLPAGFFCLGAYYIGLYIATRAGTFQTIALSRFAQGIVGPTSQILFAVVGIGTAGLLVGSVAGQSVGTMGLIQRAVRGRRAQVVLSLQRMRELARRYWRFPAIASWTALLDAAGGNQLLYLLISTQYSVKIAGFIFLVERIVARPLTMVGTSVLQVFVGEAGQTVSTDPAKLKQRFRQVVTHQFMLATGWIIVANVAAVKLLPVIFGANWSEAVIYLQAISIAYLAQSVVQPVFHTLQLLERQGIAAIWQISRVILTVTTFFLGTYFHYDAVWVVFAYSIVQAVCCSVLLGIMTKSIQRLQRASA